MVSAATPAALPAPSVAQRWSSPLRVWALLTLLWIGLALISAAQMTLARELEWDLALRFASLDWAPWIVLSPVVLWFARRVHIDGGNWVRTVPLHLAGAVLVTAAAQFIAQGATITGALPMPAPPGPFELRRGDILIGTPPTFPPGLRELGPPPHNLPRFIRARFSIPIYCVIVAAAHAVAYHRRSLERERRALAAEARLTEARLMALQTQLNPHFLFNTLNAVSSLVRKQPDAADEMICALSALLRSVLARSEQREITLTEELSFIDRYLAIQRIRFSDRLEVRRHLEPAAEIALVPTLILQPLVENAIVHGIARHAGRGVLTLTARAESDGRLVVTVSDTGDGAPPTRPPGTPFAARERIGLTNTRARLAALYGTAATFELTHAPEGGACARLVLPWRTAGSN
jgi:two-component sensor histidine kinase